jgi:ATP-dependent DNA helicase RecG
MNKTLLRQYLGQGETEAIAFVNGTREATHAEEAACGLLNARGGIILVGVNPAGRVVGVKEADAQLQALQRRLSEAISPPAALSVTVQEAGGKNLLVIDVPEGLEKPYVCRGRIMVRRGTAVVPASASELSFLIGQRGQTEGRWERLPALGVEEDDLEAVLIEKVARTIEETRGYAIDKTTKKKPIPEPPRVKPSRLFRHGPDRPRKVKKILERFGLYQAGKFTNAALVLFGKDPAERYPQTRVRAARFQGDDRANFLDNKVFEGNLFALLEALTSFLKANIPVVSTFEPNQLQRRDRLAYPFPAVREALVNALVHRDYSAFDGGMSVAVYDSRVEFWNSGRLPDDMTVEDLRTTHPSRPINPDIAQVCFLYGLMERWGIGTQKIIRACMESGLPEPDWRLDRNGVTLTLRLAQTSRPPASGSLNLRPLTVAQKLRPGDKVKLPDYLALVSSEVKARQARIDLKQLTEAGYLQRVGAGPATVYVRTNKPAPELPYNERG